jgi:hypothetical protein
MRGRKTVNPLEKRTATLPTLGIDPERTTLSRILANPPSFIIIQGICLPDTPFQATSYGGVLNESKYF